MKRTFRLTRSTDFKRVRRMGKSYAHPLVVLVATPPVNVETPMPPVRIGFVTSKSVGGAVERNRVKRRLRACVDRSLDHLRPGWDCILLARKPIAQASFTEICVAVQSVTRRAGVWYEPTNTTA